MADCLFCKIAAGTIPAEIVAQNDNVLAFRDISPQAPTHILVIPKNHVTSIAETTAAHVSLVGELVLLAKIVAEKERLANGYRMVFNTGKDGGQTVFHLHLHLLGGRQMTWPPG
jgi:histidine triad (HIT) family protein